MLIKLDLDFWITKASIEYTQAASNPTQPNGYEEIRASGSSDP